jgi:hypothetical protein
MAGGGQHPGRRRGIQPGAEGTQRVDDEGAGAIVLTTADRARDLRPRPAYIAGYGQRLAFEIAGRIGPRSNGKENR